MKLALCNEVLAHLPFAEQCRLAAALGYQGLELAPYTLGDPLLLREADGRQAAQVAAEHGLSICALHWLLARPTGLSITTADAPRRQRTLALLERLIDVAAAAQAPALVHGSPQQRLPDPGQPLADALRRAADVWAHLGERAAQAGRLYCIEPLPARLTPVVNTVAEAAAVLETAGTPGLHITFDLAAATQAETDDPAVVLLRHLGHIAHVQLNDANRRGPGQGGTAVAPVLRVLAEAGYDGWLSIEPFEFHPTPEGCAAFSAGYVTGLWRGLAPPDGR